MKDILEKKGGKQKQKKKKVHGHGGGRKGNLRRK